MRNYLEVYNAEALRRKDIINTAQLVIPENSEIQKVRYEGIVVFNAISRLRSRTKVLRGSDFFEAKPLDYAKGPTQSQRANSTINGLVNNVLMDNLPFKNILKGSLRFCVFALFILFSSTLNAQSIFPSFGSARSGTAGYQFTKVDVDARSTAMGHSAMADLTGGF